MNGALSARFLQPSLSQTLGSKSPSKWQAYARKNQPVLLVFANPADMRHGATHSARCGSNVDQHASIFNRTHVA
jgi:hypothetical protein